MGGTLYLILILILVLECISGPSKGKLIAVECKYRNSINSRNSFDINTNQISNYVNFCKRSKILEFYYIFGFGWENDAPKEVYLIPSSELYRYTIDENQDKISVDIIKHENEAEWRERYKVILDPDKSKKYIMYKNE